MEGGWDKVGEGSYVKRGKERKRRQTGNQLIKIIMMSVFLHWKYVLHHAPVMGSADFLIRLGDCSWG